LIGLRAQIRFRQARGSALFDTPASTPGHELVIEERNDLWTAVSHDHRGIVLPM